MKYKVTIHFKDMLHKTYEVTGYSTSDGILQLFNYNKGTTKIQMIPLVDIEEVEILEV
jgi:hypothetical protein